MITLRTRAKGVEFSYERTLDNRILIQYGDDRRITIAAEDYRRLIDTFKGRTVPLGTSRDSPPPHSVGKWLQENVTKTAVASYIGSILVLFPKSS